MKLGQYLISKKKVVNSKVGVIIKFLIIMWTRRNVCMALTMPHCKHCFVFC